MRIFVTGATGFIGSHFIRLALAEGHEVTALRRSVDRLPVVSLPREPRWLTKPLEEVNEQDLIGNQALVHLAASGVTPQPATWDECFRFNTGVSLALAETAIAAAVPTIVVAGTYAEYGKAGLRFDPIPPNAPLEPTDPYAASKAAACIALTSLARQRNIRLFYGRIFSAFGEGQYATNFWPQLRDAAVIGSDLPMTAGEQVRDFVPVEHVARIFLHACSRLDLVPGEPMIRNVASGKPVTLREFAENWWKHWSATGSLLVGKVPYRTNEVMRYVPEVEEPLV